MSKMETVCGMRADAQRKILACRHMTEHETYVEGEGVALAIQKRVSLNQGNID